MAIGRVSVEAQMTVFKPVKMSKTSKYLGVMQRTISKICGQDAPIHPIFGTETANGLPLIPNPKYSTWLWVPPRKQIFILDNFKTV